MLKVTKCVYNKNEWISLGVFGLLSLQILKQQEFNGLGYQYALVEFYNQQFTEQSLNDVLPPPTTWFLDWYLVPNKPLVMIPPKK